MENSESQGLMDRLYDRWMIQNYQGRVAVVILVQEIALARNPAFDRDSGNLVVRVASNTRTKFPERMLDTWFDLDPIVLLDYYSRLDCRNRLDEAPRRSLGSVLAVDSILSFPPWESFLKVILWFLWRRFFHTYRGRPVCWNFCLLKLKTFILTLSLDFLINSFVVSVIFSRISFRYLYYLS